MVNKSKMLKHVDKLVKENGKPTEIKVVQSSKAFYYIILMFGNYGFVVNEIKYHINARRVKKDIDSHLQKRVD